MPKISVTIPTYNRANLVKEAIESVLAQTFSDLEVVVIDDGSTDRTPSVVEAIKDDRVKYYYKNNGGCASARNFGIAKCTGDYIAILDSDDLWPEDFLEVMLNHLESNPEYGCVYCPITVVYPDGTRKASYKTEHCKSGWITKELFKNSFIWIQAALFRKSVLENLVFDESMKNGADTDALLRLSTKTEFLFVTDVEAIFRAEHGVTSRKDQSSLNCNRIRILERFYCHLGGDKLVPPAEAKRKLSHAYRSVAKNYYQNESRSAAVFLYKQAICYWPLDIRLYLGLLRSLLISKGRDKQPDWQMPGHLPEME